jgi:hypothetical protein
VQCQAQREEERWWDKEEGDYVGGGGGGGNSCSRISPLHIASSPTSVTLYPCYQQTAVQ